MRNILEEGTFVESIDFKKYYEHGMNLYYYGTKKVIIVDYYEVFGFVDVMDYGQSGDGFSLPISVLTLEEKRSNSIYLNKIYDMSRF